ncbi:MAG: hypothetical protein ACHREM_27505 [Polyangiales bacterium]
MIRLRSIVLLTSLCLLVSTPSFAHRSGTTSIADESEHKFPMPAVDFRKHIAAKEERAREHMEKYIAKKELTKEQADELRGRFDVALAKLDKRVDEVCSDGTVTKEEADTVHALAKALLHEIRAGE